MIICIMTTFVFLSSCDENNPPSYEGEAYDPSKPVIITDFKPDSGGLATKVFITGSNFGSDLTKIKVYFNDMRAPVVGSDGNRMYVITPRQPGRENIISVVVNNDSVAFTAKKYLYRTMTTVTTIAGKKGTTEFKGGTLSEAEFHNPSTLCIDAEGNIFLSHWRVPYCFVLINQEKDLVEAIYPGSNNGIDAFGAPTADANGRMIMAPTDGGDGYWSFDPDAQWAPKSRLMIHPTVEMMAEGKRDWVSTNRLGMAACRLEDDNNIYTHFNNGHLMRYDPLTRLGELVDIITAAGTFLYFDPYQPSILYLVFPGRHMIYSYDVITHEYTLFAGTDSKAGWVDGHRLQAEFNQPSQIVIDKDGSMYIADRLNHCIRRITPDGMVSTVIGKGGIAGYQDGNPEDALFDNPRGVAIDDEGTIYVADYENNCVRKLAIE